MPRALLEQQVQLELREQRELQALLVSQEQQALLVPRVLRESQVPPEQQAQQVFFKAKLYSIIQDAHKSLFPFQKFSSPL